MSMTAGTCTMAVSASGTTYTAAYAGSGMALALIQARGPVLLTQLNAAIATVVAATKPPSPPLTAIPASAIASAQAAATNLATESQAMASGLVTYLTTNAKATITTSTSCGVMPSATTPGTALGPPAAAVTLAIS